MNRELGQFEKAQVITNEHFPFNAVIVLRLVDGPHVETLKEVLEFLQQRHPLLGALVRKKKSHYFFIFEGTPGIPVKVIDRRDDNHWLNVVEEEVNRKIDIVTGPPVGLCYLTSPGNADGCADRDGHGGRSGHDGRGGRNGHDGRGGHGGRNGHDGRGGHGGRSGHDGHGGRGECEIIFTFQHAVMDASSGAAFLREVLALCQKWEAGEPLGKVERLELLPPAEFFFPAAFKGIRRKWNTFKFMLRQMGDEFSYRGGTKGKRQAPIHENGRNKVLTFGLSPEVSAAIIKLSRRMRVTVNDLFNAVLMKAVHLHIYKGEELPFRHFNFADLRPYLKPPLSCDYLGSYFSMMRYTVPMKGDVDIRDLARVVGGIAYSSLKRGDKFSANLLSALMMKAMLRFKAFRMGTTALSYTGSINLETSYGDIKVRGLHAFVSNFGLGPEYTAQVRLFDNCFYWDILYLDSDMDEKQARHIAGKIEALLKEVVA